jgi:hypothetical protein
VNEHSHRGEEQANRPVVFVGSSSEALLLAEAVQKGLGSVADVVLWSQGVFELSQSYLESLTATLETSDFAVLVLTPDDLVESRGESTTAPRDNVMFELGLFMGRLGRERCFLLFDNTQNIKLPTDLLGICAATYRPHQSGNLEAAIGPACTSIKLNIQRLKHKKRLDPEVLPSRTSVYRRATEMLRRASTQALDTTWGTDTPVLKGAERKAADGYLEAKKMAIARGVEYKELFTPTDSDRRQKRMAEAKDLHDLPNNYYAKLIDLSLPDLPLIDFLVVDCEYLLLSFLSEDPTVSGHQYIFLQSKTVATHFAEYFSLCWKSAVAKSVPAATITKD